MKNYAVPASLMQRIVDILLDMPAGKVIEVLDAVRALKLVEPPVEAVAETPAAG